ncbi:hypothetical protein AC578_986 [Pseudocercospora eumusae]|uniref:Uncharacterized protein n=1 Tax=Pseudocercospora eumusae TaxID=321146 RepID=A0A139HEI3_9PEZI|nr:hypothetical protein AC578_986 [Pseudocercospora eumusae]
MPGGKIQPATVKEDQFRMVLARALFIVLLMAGENDERSNWLDQRCIEELMSEVEMGMWCIYWARQVCPERLPERMSA